MFLFSMASSSNAFTATFDVNPTTSNITFMEHVVVNMSLSIVYMYNFSDYGYYRFPKRGDIRVELTSPQGTVSILLPYI